MDGICETPELFDADVVVYYKAQASINPKIAMTNPR